MMQVKLTNWERKAAIDCANMRMTTSDEAGWNNASTYKRTFTERLAEEVIGACGEIALCKLMNWFWSPSVNTFHHTPDVGSDIEVRSTQLETGSLIVRDNDADERWYVLVTGDGITMTIRGRIRGADAKRPEWVRDPNSYRPAWFVPQTHLLPLPTADFALNS